MTEPPGPSGPASSIVAALTEVSQQYSIPEEDLVRAVEDALAAAYKRAFEPDGYVTAHLDRATGELAISLRVRSADGDHTHHLPADGFARLAAQTARQAVQKHLRGLERERVRAEMDGRRGEMVTGPIDRFSGGICFVDLGAAEGVMPPEEQIPGEEYHPGRSLTAVVVEARMRGPRTQVIISRASKLFVQRLLQTEVPEIAAGTVAIMAIAREAGLRTKIAVAAMQPGIDAVGACVGPKGVRHQSLLAQLSHEHLDIVPWSDSPERLVAAALGPARVTSVQVDAATRTALVEVPANQLSLAIGKDGQNARLAAKLTGWRIDIHPAEEADGGQPVA